MQNFGKIKQAFNDMLAEAIVTKDKEGKLLFQKYLKMLKESEILKTQCLIYLNLEGKVDTDAFSSNTYVNENIGLMSQFKKADIISENNRLLSLSEDVKAKAETKAYDEKLSNLHEAITSLIFTKKTAATIDTITENTTKVVQYLNTNVIKETVEAIELPMSMLSKFIVEKFNEKYSDLSESDKSILKKLIDSDDEGKQEIYNNLVRECIDKINENLITVDTDLETKGMLLSAKDKLLNQNKTIDENFDTNILKLVDLKNSLTIE